MNKTQLLAELRKIWNERLKGFVYNNTTKDTSFVGNVTTTGSTSFIDSTKIGVKDTNLNDSRPAVMYYDLARYNSGSTLTGALKINLPVGWNTTMLDIDVSLYQYKLDGGMKFFIRGYNFNGGSGPVPSGWKYPTLNIVGGGDTALPKVRLAYDGNKCCIVIGETTTSWSWPHVNIDKVRAYYSGANTFIRDGWTISTLTDDSSLTDVVELIPNNTFCNDLAVNGNSVFYRSVTTKNVLKIENIIQSPEINTYASLISPALATGKAGIYLYRTNLYSDSAAVAAGANINGHELIVASSNTYYTQFLFPDHMALGIKFRSVDPDGVTDFYEVVTTYPKEFTFNGKLITTDKYGLTFAAETTTTTGYRAFLYKSATELFIGLSDVGGTVVNSKRPLKVALDTGNCTFAHAVLFSSTIQVTSTATFNGAVNINNSLTFKYNKANNFNGTMRFAARSGNWSTVLTDPAKSVLYQEDYTGWFPIINMKSSNGRAALGTYTTGLNLIYFLDDNTTNSPDNTIAISATQTNFSKPISVTGNITATGTISGNTVANAIWNDYAEMFPRGEETTPGDLIMLSLDSGNEELYVKAIEGSTCVVGVESNEFAHIIGGDRAPEGQDHVEYNLPRFIPVGLAGRVRTKVIGPVMKGCKIVPSHIPGVGRAYNADIDSMESVVGFLVESDSIEDSITIRKLKLKLK